MKMTVLMTETREPEDGFFPGFRTGCLKMNARIIYYIKCFI